MTGVPSVDRYTPTKTSSLGLHRSLQPLPHKMRLLQHLQPRPRIPLRLVVYHIAPPLQRTLSPPAAVLLPPQRPAHNHRLHVLVPQPANTPPRTVAAPQRCRRHARLASVPQRHDVAGGPAGREVGPVEAGRHPPCAAVQPPLQEWCVPPLLRGWVNARGVARRARAATM